MPDILNLLTEYSEAIASLGVITTFLGGVIGYSLKALKDKKNNLKTENEALKKQLQIVKAELKQLKSIEKTDREIVSSPLGGDCLYFKTKNQYICPVCWYAKHKIVPVFDTDKTGYFKCQICGQEGNFNPQIISETQSVILGAIDDYYRN